MTYEALRRILGPALRGVWRLEVRGIEHVPASGPLVVVANHESVLDPFVLGAALPRTLHFLGKAELWRVPLLGRALDHIGQIPVVRGGNDLEAMAAAVRALEEGEVVALFPEGGVLRADQEWRRGAARMALAAGAPLLPVRLLDVRRAVGRGVVGFPRLGVLVGEPIPVERAQPTPALARALTTRAREAVEALGR